VLTDTRRLDDVLEVGPLEPMSDEELAAMFSDAEVRGLMAAPRALGQLLDDLRELPQGIATRVRADLLIADVLEALGGTPAPYPADGDDLPDLYATCGTCQAEVPFERRFCPDCGADQLGDGEHA
jgi:hypothetical protein